MKNNIIKGLQEKLGCFLPCKKSKKKKKSTEYKEKKVTFTKMMVGVIVIMAELQITSTYVLAFLDKSSTGEALSEQITITVIGVALGYFLKSCIENLSKYGGNSGKNEFDCGDVDNSTNQVNQETVSDEGNNCPYNEEPNTGEFDAHDNNSVG